MLYNINKNTLSNVFTGYFYVNFNIRDVNFSILCFMEKFSVIMNTDILLNLRKRVSKFKFDVE